MSDGYKVPIELEIEGLNDLKNTISNMEALHKAGKEATDGINKMNKEFVAGAESVNKTLLEQGQALLASKKAAEERVKVERVMVQLFDEVAKKQGEGVKLTEHQTKIVDEYSKGLEYAKKALKEATDPAQVKVIAKDMEVLRDKIVAVYDRASKAISPMNVKLQEAGSLIDKLSDSLMGSFSDDELKGLSTSINNAGNEMDQLGVLIDFISGKMEGMDAGSDLFQQLTKDIEVANQMLGRTNEMVDLSSMSWDQLTDRLKFFQDSLKGETNPQEIIRINQEIANTEEQLKRIKNAGKDGFDDLGNKIIPEAAEKVKSLNTQLEETVQQLARMRMEGKVDTPEYDELLAKATEIKQAITAVNDELKKTTSNTQSLDTLIESASLVTAGFNLAQGSLALFGAESEDLEKVTAKLAAGIAVLQGLQEIQVQLKNRESVANKALTASQALYTTVVGTSTGALKVFRIALAATGIGLIILAIGALVASWDKLTASIKISGPEAEKWGQRIDKIKAIAIGVGNSILQFLVAPIKALYTLFTDGPSAAVDSFTNSLNLIKNYNEGFNWEIQKQNDEAHLKKLEAQKAALEKEIEIRKAKGEEIIAQQRALNSTLLAISAFGSKEEQEQALHDAKVSEAQMAKEVADKAKRVADKTKQERDKADKEAEKELQRIKDFNRKLIDMENDLQESLIKAMQEGQEKEEAAELLRFEKEKLALKRQLDDVLADTKVSAEEKSKFKEVTDRQIQALEEQHISIMWAIGVDYFDKLQEAQRQSNKILLEVNKQDQELEIFQVQEKYRKLAEEYKKASGEEKDFTEQMNKEIEEVNVKYRIQGIKDEEEYMLRMNNLVQQKGVYKERQERLNAINSLDIQKRANDKEIEELKKLSDEKSKKRVALLELENKELMQKRDELVKENNNKGLDLFEWLGIGEVTKEKILFYADKLSKTAEVFSEFFDALGESFRLQAEEKKKQVDALSKQVDSVESELDRELEAQKNGYASNVDAKKAELEALQTERAKALKEQEEAEKKQRSMQKAKIVADTLMQTSNLITSASNIFSWASSVPFVGVPLAIGLIGTMLATFAITKANAFKEINNSKTPSFRHGGVFMLNGPSHEQGGLGVYNESTGQRVAEVEGGEGFFAISRENKHLIPEFQRLHDEGLDFFRSQSPVDKTKINEVIVMAQEQRTQQHQIFDAQTLNDIASIAKTNQAMLENEKNKEERIDMGDHWFVRLGPNHTRKIWKSKS